jgi:hypothetical protein
MGGGRNWLRIVQNESCDKCVENFGRKPEGKRPLGGPRRRWENNIRMDVTEIRWAGVDYIHLTQDRDYWRVVVNKVMYLRVP